MNLWNCRKNNQIPLFLSFEDVVKKKYEIADLIAFQSNLSLKHFQAKWNPVLNINSNYLVFGIRISLLLGMIYMLYW